MSRPANRTAVFALMLALVFPALSNVVLASAEPTTFDCGMHRSVPDRAGSHCASEHESGRDVVDTHVQGGPAALDDPCDDHHCASCVPSMAAGTMQPAHEPGSPSAPDIAGRYPNQQHTPIFRPPRA